MTFKYVGHYWYRDPKYGYEHEGEYYTNDLCDVFAFGEMCVRYGGTFRCAI